MSTLAAATGGSAVVQPPPTSAVNILPNLAGTKRSILASAQPGSSGPSAHDRPPRTKPGARAPSYSPKATTMPAPFSQGGGAAFMPAPKGLSEGSRTLEEQATEAFAPDREQAFAAEKKAGGGGSFYFWLTVVLVVVVVILVCVLVYVLNTRKTAVAAPARSPPPPPPASYIYGYGAKDGVLDDDAADAGIAGRRGGAMRGSRASAASSRLHEAQAFLHKVHHQQSSGDPSVLEEIAEEEEGEGEEEQEMLEAAPAQDRASARPSPSFNPAPDANREAFSEEIDTSVTRQRSNAEEHEKMTGVSSRESYGNPSNRNGGSQSLHDLLFQQYSAEADADDDS